MKPLKRRILINVYQKPCPRDTLLNRLIHDKKNVGLDAAIFLHELEVGEYQ
jgi:hypothetical protein